MWSKTRICKSSTSPKAFVGSIAIPPRTALTYFAQAYHLKQLAIETDGKEPSAASMKKLIDEARAQHVRVVFVQREFDRKHAESVAREIGARVVVIDPLSAQWKDEMLKIGQALAKP